LRRGHFICAATKGFGIAHRLADDLPPEGLQEAPESAHPALQGGRVESYDPREQVREKPLGVAQKGALGLHAPQLLQEREGYDLRVREPLERLVALPIGVEQRVGIVDEAEEDGVRASSVRARRWVWLGWAIRCSFARGDYDGPLSTPNPRNTHLGPDGRAHTRTVLPSGNLLLVPQHPAYCNVRPSPNS
jgi:hypothetical protein